MHILPFAKYNIDSNLSENEIGYRLSCSFDNIESFSEKHLKGSTRSKDFEGYISDGKYHFRRRMKIGYSGFIPMAHVKTSEEIKGKTKVSVKINPRKSVSILLLLLLLFFLIISFSTIRTNINPEYQNKIEEINQITHDSELNLKPIPEQNFSNLFPSIMFSFLPFIGFYLFYIILFNLELKLLKSFFESIDLNINP